MSDDEQSRWSVSLIGAREHYAVPRGFHYRNRLRTFYTEAWCRWGASWLSRHGPAGARAFAKRWHPHLPSSKVVSFTLATMFSRLASRRPASTQAQYDFFSRQGAWFARRVARHLERQALDPRLDRFLGFDSACLETVQTLKPRGVFTVVDQIDPARTEEQIVYDESLKWPGWQQRPGRIPASYFDRISQEWDAADMVLVNSEWSKSALVSQGVSAEKLFVVPLAYEPESDHVEPRRKHDGPLRVLWLGTVNLRKGIPYLIEAAKQLPGVRFIVAGPLQISDRAVASASSNVEFVGRVTRDRTAEVYRGADVFVLPTMSDGFGITQIEAMGHGLPVIATPNCGQVVTDGIDGLIVPAGDSAALTAAVARLDADRPLVEGMSRNAIAKSGTFRLPKQTDDIEAEVQRRLGQAAARG